MRLSRIQVWNFRSFSSEDNEWSETPCLDITLTPGVNYLSGPNNAGKSNILRALAFALDPNAPFDPNIDRSHDRTFGPVVVLEFTAGNNPSPPIRTFLQQVDELEHAIEDFAEPSLASQGIVRFYVEQKNGWREEAFLTRDSWNGVKGSKAGKHRRAAIEKLRDLVKYVDIKSGEDLQSLLQRGFKDVLASAVFDEHEKAMQNAVVAGEAYRSALGQMLRPIARHVQERIRPYVSDVEEIDLIAQVPSVEDAIAAARIEVKDAVQTPLEHKGTGVRGAMLLLLLSFIADSAKTSVLFGIEEPEAFLHPNAHRALGDGLARFTRREDVTLLVTTHSPFLYRADGDPRNAVFRVTKDGTGRSSVARAAPEAARVDLLGSSVIANLLDAIEAVPEKARLIIVLEGETDAKYFQLAARHLGIGIADWHFAFYKKGINPENEKGAAGAAIQAVTLAARHTPGRVVAALFDSDEEGQSGYQLLRTTFGWKHKKPADGVFAFLYSQWIPDFGVGVEAEDIFDPAFLESFFQLPGNDAFKTGSKLREKSGRWHYDLSPKGKIALVKWLEENGTPQIFQPWRPVIEHLAQLVSGASK